MPRIMPEARYFSMPSTVLGADVRRKRLELLSVNAVIHPFARCNDPFASGNCCGVSDHRNEVAVPTRFRPQDANPFSALWKVTRSTSPANTSWVDDSGCELIGTIVSETFRASIWVRPRYGHGPVGNRVEYLALPVRRAAPNILCTVES